MKTAEVLVEHGADINVLNRYNESPLYLAAENTKDSTDLVVYLVERLLLILNQFGHTWIKKSSKNWLFSSNWILL